MTATGLSNEAVGLLVARAQRGDTVALNELLDEIEPYVARICGAIALADGADATQETLVVVFRRLSTLREPAAFRGWVRAIATREAVRIARRTAGHDELRDVAETRDEHLSADVVDTLRALTPEHRAVLVLRDLEGLPETDVAAMLDVSVGTVKSRLHRARRRFRELWT